MANDQRPSEDNGPGQVSATTPRQYLGWKAEGRLFVWKPKKPPLDFRQDCCFEAESLPKEATVVANPDAANSATPTKGPMNR